MLNIQNFAWRHFHDVRTYGSPISDLRVNCPFCDARYGKADTTFKLYISLNKHTCHCFRCGYSRSWVGLVMDVTGLDYVQAWGELYCVPRARNVAALKRAAVPDEMEIHHCGDEIVYPVGFQLATSSAGLLAARARAYLTHRGFTSYHIKKYSLGVSADIGWRVIIPIEGEFWQARAIFPFMQPKYLHPKTESRHYVFNFAALEMHEEVAVCEGAFSAMSIGENAVGLLRNKATAEQVRRLLDSSVRRFIVALDADARIHSVNLVAVLRRGGKEVVVWHYADGDPADGGDFQEVIPDLKYEVAQRLAL